MTEKWLDHRDLSWLKFNLRVLKESDNKKVPLGERLSFMRIFQTNLDEFFRVRLSSLAYTQDSAKKREELEACLKQTHILTTFRNHIFQTLVTDLNTCHFHLLQVKDCTTKQQNLLKKYFKKEILPLLSPLIVSKRQPFPFMNNGAMYVVAGLLSKKGKYKLGMFSIEHALDVRLIPVEGKKDTFVFVEDIILQNLDMVFDKHRILSSSLVRITRSGDIDEEDELLQSMEDNRELMGKLIRLRRQLPPIRLEIVGSLKDEEKRLLEQYLDLKSDYVFHEDAPLDYGFISEIRDYLKTSHQSSLFYTPLVPGKSRQVKDKISMIKQISKKDILLSYPFESIHPFLRLLNEASEDERVVSIKMTLYRVAKRSKIIQALMKAAQNGKEVVVLIELRARFDEENNIDWSKKLEDAGCHILYGLEGYKVHSKLCLITYKTDQGIRYCFQVGTGNYNEVTAQVYTDFALLSGRQEIGEEINQIFNHLSLQDKENETKYLMVAPMCMLSQILSKIDQQITLARQGKVAYLGFKVNALTDGDMIDKLIEASQAGVKIDLIIRGACCLIPGIKGKTENIRVISIVGRYLEHSRIYIFGAKEAQQIYISSADLMTRNLRRRIEVGILVMDNEIQKQILYMFNTMLKDNTKAHILRPDGKYYPVENHETSLNSQEHFFKKLK